MRIISAALLAGLLLGSTPGLHAATIYKWTDNQGQTHFGSQPPAGQDSQRITTHTPKQPTQPAPTPTPATDMASPADNKTQAEIDAEVRRQVVREQAELQTYCTDMRTRLAQLKNNPRLLAEIDGQMVRLSEEERQNRITEAENKIIEHCNNR